ncbi:hypothetical protein [Nostoc sp.]
MTPKEYRSVDVMRSPNSYFNQVEKLLEELSNKNSEQDVSKVL